MISKKSDCGWISVFVALSLVMLCGFVALAVDVGSFLSARTSAQRAADAGALAGALTYVTGGNATEHATQVAASNQIMGANIPTGEVTVEFPASRQVKVTINHNAPIFFAKVLGMQVAPIKAEAIAEASAQPYSSECVKPLFIPNTYRSPKDPCTEYVLPPPDRYRYALVDGAGQVTPFASDQLGGFDKINVKSVNEPLYPLPSGRATVFATVFRNDTQTGSTLYGQNISNCPGGIKISCNSTYQIKSESGPILNSTTLTEFTNLANANGSPDTWVDVGQYRESNGNIYNTSHQLITVPIFDVYSIPDFCSSPTDTIKNPDEKIKVVGFARMFSMVIGGDVRFFLVGLSGCSDAQPDSPETGPYGYPVRLVHN
jgi:hypothetical protein